MDIAIKVNGKQVAGGTVPISIPLGFTVYDGLDFGSDFRAFFANSQRQGEERLAQQLHNQHPFHALEYAGINSPAIERVRSAVTAAGCTLRIDRSEGSEEQEYGLRARS